MKITLVLSGDTISDVLNQFKTQFSFDWVEIEKKFSRHVVFLSEFLIEYSIRELKAMNDFLVTTFNIAGLAAPKRNSKISLAIWIEKVLLSAREVDASEEAIRQTTDVKCPNCGFAHEPGQNSLCTYTVPSSEIEVLEPEVYTILIIADGSFSEERVSRLPPYLVDRKGRLLKKLWHRSCDASYTEIVSKQLSNIAVKSGLVIKLTAENLEVSQACICGDLPPFIIDRRGGVYKRDDRVRQGLAICYAQVVSEYLSNIVVV
jgi:hypothetical protein